MKNMFKSLAAFQQECPTIHKGTKSFGYSYADLPTIFGVINPLLKKHGLGFTQLIQEDGIKTIVFHIESGEQMECTTLIPDNVQLKGMNDFQVLGSAITYIRRYALSSVLGLVTDKDVDASGDQIQQPKKEVKQDRPKLLPETDAWQKAREYILDGGDLEKIKAKYDISPTLIRQLKSI